MRYHLSQKFFGKMVNIKETSFLSTRGMILIFGNCICLAYNCNLRPRPAKGWPRINFWSMGKYTWLCICSPGFYPSQNLVNRKITFLISLHFKNDLLPYVSKLEKTNKFKQKKESWKYLLTEFEPGSFCLWLVHFTRAPNFHFLFWKKGRIFAGRYYDRRVCCM